MAGSSRAYAKRANELDTAGPSDSAPSIRKRLRKSLIPPSVMRDGCGRTSGALHLFQLRKGVCSGNLRPMTQGGRVEKQLRTIIERARRVDPAERWRRAIGLIGILLVIIGALGVQLTAL